MTILPSQVSRSILRVGLDQSVVASATATARKIDPLHTSLIPVTHLRAFPAKMSLADLMSKDSQNQLALAFLRVAVGLLFLIFGQYKVFSTQFTLHGGFQFWINRFLQQGAYPFMIPILRGFVLPHATPIAFLVAYSELAIGIALTLGILVRAASLGGLVFMLTLLFSSDYPGLGVPLWQYFGASLDHSVLALCFAAFLIGRADSVCALHIPSRKSTVPV
jgi:thiosulfate dehydrogenase (quinone) large subunit